MLRRVAPLREFHTWSSSLGQSLSEYEAALDAHIKSSTWHQHMDMSTECIATSKRLLEMCKDIEPLLPNVTHNHGCSSSDATVLLKRCCVGASLNAMKLKRAVTTGGNPILLGRSGYKLSLNTDMSILFPIPELKMDVAAVRDEGTKQSR